MSRALLIAAAIGVALYLAALAALWFAQRDLLFQPAGDSMQPAEAGLPQAIPLDIRTIDGERLRIWHIAPQPGRVVFLYFHGNAGSLADRVATFRALTQRGDGLIALSYRGYPGSTGDPSEEGLARDADAAYAQAQALGYGGDRLVLVGESLGAGLAAPLAARRSVAALVLDAPFFSAVDVAAGHYWMFPVRLLMRDPFRSDLAIGSVQAPVLILHGARDPITPIAQGRRLFAAAVTAKAKDMIEVPDGGHLVLDRTMDRTLDWVERVVAR